MYLYLGSESKSFVGMGVLQKMANIETVHMSFTKNLQ